MPQEIEELSLKEQFKHALEEARIVVPGIQALFGFQLIAVFNDRFESDLTIFERDLHMGATALTALAVVLALAPASIHRQAEPAQVSTRLVKSASAFLTASLVPLVFGMAMDFYILSRLILESEEKAFLMAIILFAIFVLFWFVFPQVQRRRGVYQRKNGGHPTAE
jgi:hypothetical protein